MSVAHGEQVRVLEDHGQESGRSMNWWGMVFFISSEALIFANLIAAYLYLEIRNSGAEVWRLENVIYPAFNTAVLLSSSFFVHMAGSGIRKGNVRQLIIGLAVTIFLALVFLGGQVYEYITLIFTEKFTISSSIFGSAFFTLTGFHGLHVTIGAIFLTVCLIRASLGHFSKEQHFAVEAAEMYWHFVDVVWVFVFTLVYIVPLLR